MECVQKRKEKRSISIFFSVSLVGQSLFLEAFFFASRMAINLALEERYGRMQPANFNQIFFPL
jgi:hypothetical protein